MPVQSTCRFYTEVAETYHLLLVSGFPVREQLVRWADEELAEHIEPDPFLSEISTSSMLHLNDLISLLQRYVGYEKPLASSRAVIGYLADNFAKGFIPLEKVCDSLCRLERQGGLSHEEKYLIAGLDDEYGLTKDGTKGTVEEIVAYIQRFLQMYIGFRLENPESWSGNSDRLEGEVRRLFQIVREERAVFIQHERIVKQKRWWKWW